MPTGPDTVDAPETSRPEPGSRRGVALLLGAAAVAVAALVLWWFQPQALLFDQVVDESFPSDVAAEPVEGHPEERDDAPDQAEGPVDAAAVEPAPADAPVAEQPTATAPVELASGSFVSRNRYTVTGSATLHELTDGQRILRLEDFASTNGPDLLVYLTVAGSADDDAALDADFVDLGTLTGNIGDQNYVVPEEVDLDRYDSVAIWCRRFTTSFGVADLAAN